ncbi:hypothetical protein SAMN05216251_108244 [Actinacidiphila alni]|uniref:Uncharacterized protein n=1 Tax=Actinacidiphila alni TaxID=380248 RepID=A0A1I2G2R1_9ACTN|nr:hypothetical protein SAMN05216251_108244 [Actinacidiphila alni]
MGIRLIVEVLDHAPQTLSHRERLLLAVLAEDANDDTRITWGSVQSPTVRRRASLSRTQLYEVLKSLVAAGVLKKVAAGQKNATAKYELLPLDRQSPVERDADETSQSPAPQDTETPQRPVGRDAKGKFSVPQTGTLTESQSPAPQDTEKSQSPAGRDVSVPLDGTPTPQPPTTKRSLPPREDVEQVCNHLADRIEANGSRRPRVTDRWRTAARLLIDQDKREVDQILRAIDWCQADPFWRANVMSMPKLRERYDQLRLKATAEREQQQREAASRARQNPNSYADRGIF